MYSDENKSSAVAAILNRFDYVLIDTCSLMDPACPIWMDALHNAKDYRKTKDPIIVPRRCYDELKKHSRDRVDDSKRISAKRGLKILRKAKWDRLLAVAKKDKNENFADNAIYVKVCADRLFSKILIITQDKSLATDLLALNKLRSQQGRPVEVYKLVSDGKMVPNLGEPKDDRREPRVGGHYRPVRTVMDTPVQPKVKEQNGTTPESIRIADVRLCAVLSNPNYPDEKKRADAEAQLKAIESLSPSQRSKLSVKLGPDSLKEYLKDGTITYSKPAEKAKEPSQKAKATPAQNPAPEKKAVTLPKQPEAPKPAKKTKSKDDLWYGKGKTVRDGFLDCAKHYGILFRSASVKYFPEAHGPLDVTESDLDNIVMTLQAKLGQEEKASLVFLETTFIAQKHDDHFHCYIDVIHSPAFLKGKEESEKPSPKKEEAKPAKAEAPKEAKAAEKPVKKPAKTTKKAAKPADNSENEQPAQPVKEAPKPKAKKSKPASEEKAEKAVEPAVAKPAKPAPKKKAKPAAEAAVEPAAKKEAAKPAEEKAPKAKAKKEEGEKPSPLEQAKKAEHSLKCNLKNPNYSPEKKTKAIDKQLALIAKLTPEEASELTLSAEALSAMRGKA